MAIVADQSEVIVFLQGHLAGRSGPVRTISTHASLVFLTANRASLELAYSLEQGDYRGEKTTELHVADVRVPVEICV